MHRYIEIVFWSKHKLFYFLHLQVTKKGFPSFRSQILLTCLLTAMQILPALSFLLLLFPLALLGFTFVQWTALFSPHRSLGREKWEWFYAASEWTSVNIGFIWDISISQIHCYQTCIAGWIYIAWELKCKDEVYLNSNLWGNKVQYHKLKIDSGYILDLLGDMLSAKKWRKACMKALEGTGLLRTDSYTKKVRVKIYI